MLSCIGYLSSATSNGKGEALDQILKQARRRNDLEKVTGLLCEFDGNFLQFLEGESDVIAATFDRISHDTRHSGLIKIYDQPIAERGFSSWSMALITHSQMTEDQALHFQRVRSLTLSPSSEAPHLADLNAFLKVFQMWN